MGCPPTSGLNAYCRDPRFAGGHYEDIVRDVSGAMRFGEGSPKVLNLALAALMVLSGSLAASAAASWTTAGAMGSTPFGGAVASGAPAGTPAPLLNGPPGIPNSSSPGAGTASTVGNGHDWVGVDPSGTIGTASLTFSMSGFSSETDVCPADFSWLCGSRTETNAYSLQINTNRFSCNTAFTDGVTATCWEQFVYDNCPNLSCIGASGYGTQENIFIEYWLIGFVTASTPCSSLPSIPDGGQSWNTAGTSCYADTTHQTATGIPPSDLSNLDLSAVVTGSTDTIRLADSGCSGCDWSWSETDSILGLASSWTQSEGNVFGWNDGSQATYNSGTSITVTQRFAPTTGQGSFVPGCRDDLGTTGETNNLFLNPCTTFGDGLTFLETSSPPVTVVTTTVVDAATNTAWTSGEPWHSSAYDTAVVGGGATPTGTVNYRFWTNHNCAGSSTVSSGVTLSSGLAPPSAPVGPLSFGLYSFRAAYSGDGNNVGSVSACEPFALTLAIVHFHLTFQQLATPWWLCVSPTLPACHPGFRWALNRSVEPWINLSLPQGQYYYSAFSNGSFAPTQGSFAVGAGSPTINITYTPASLYPVTFSASGLGNTPDWDVWVSPFCLPGCNLTTGPITMMLANGTYSYFPHSGSPTLGAPAGRFVVDGGATSVPVSFVQAYAVTFKESGLPPGTNWVLNVSGAPVQNSTASSMVENLSIGKYTCTVASSNKIWVPNSPKVSFGVNTSGVVVSVVFHLLTYPVLWTLPPGGPLSVSKLLARHGWTAELGGEAEHVSGSSVSFSVPNGSYPYLLAGPRGVVLGGPGAPASGLISVNGSRVSVQVGVAKGSTANLKFTERGLSRGTPWCVELSGSEKCSTSSSASFLNLTPTTASTGPMTVAVVSPLNGETVTARIGKVPLTLPGTISVARSTTVALTFAYLYHATFTESGLTSGSWSVTIKGQTLTNASGDPISFPLTNGTYSYRIGAIAGLRSLSQPKPLQIDGASGSVSVTFVARR